MVNASRPSATSCCLIAISCLAVFVFFGLTESPASASASEGPVAAYSFDEGEGSTVEDLAGEHDGTIEGAEWARGRYGGGLQFDGENDCVNVPDSPDFELTEEFTLEAWVKPEGSLGEDPVISKEAEGEDSYGFGIAFFAGGKAEGFIGEGEEAYKYVSSSEAIEPKAWTHIAFTYDGAQMRIYVNGELAGTHAMSQAPLPGAGPLTIGCDEAFGEHFQGRIDEVRVGNRALDAAAIAADKSAPIQTPQQGPVAAYSFDEGEGETAEDVTGNGHTATLEGATWARGRYGSGLSFDGENDCVSIEATSDLQLTEEFTLEAWVRPTGSGEEANPFLTMEDEGAGPEEEPYAYTFLAGENEVPKAWVRKSGEAGFQGIYGEEPLPEHAWAHLALTDDGAKLRLYVDGELVRTTPAPEVTAASGPLTIGCDKLFPAYFEGRVDEVRIYNRILNEAEVQGDKSAPIQTPQQGPVAAYSFDEGEGETAEDVTGNEHTATLEGATWARGRYGSGLSFDGKEDCVSIEATSDLQFTEEFTLEAWVRPEGSGEESLPAISMDDEGSPGEEEPYAYELLAGQNELPKAWVRKGGESGFRGVYGEEHLPEHAWAHLALTDDGAHIRLYVDGQLVDTNVAPNLTTAKGPLEIGCGIVNGSFKGRIDEVRIYNRVLGEGEVQGDKSAPIQTPQQGPVAAYSFDEGEGTTAEDVTGDGHTATLEGATWARGRYGDGLEFNGTSSCVSIAATSDLQLTEEFTLEAWVRPTGSGPEANPFITMEDSEAGEEEEPFAYTFLAGENEVPKAWVRKSGEEGFQGIYGKEPLPEHAWAHLALTNDGAKLRLYVDGELVRTTPAPEVTAASGPLTIGCDKLFPAYFEGRVDEVRIYNRVLGEGEVQGDKSAPIQTPQQGPVAAYAFDEGKGEAAEDLTGDGHTATLEGASWARGKYGSGLSFDGENDCVTVPESSELDFSEEFTLEAWVKAEGELHHDPILFKEGEGFPSYALGIGIPHSGKAEGVIGQEGEGHENVYSSESLEAKVWAHLATTFDGAKLRLYVNGELVATETAENADSGSPGPLTIGCDALYGAHFQGKIDEVRVYDRALDDQEVRPDVTPPSASTNVDSMFEENEEEDDSYITWMPSKDPTFSDGYPGSGIKQYEFQYRLPSGPWSSSETVPVAAAEIPGGEAGQEYVVKLTPVDNAGNEGPTVIAHVISTAPVWGPGNVGGERPGEISQVPPMYPEPETLKWGNEPTEPASQLKTSQSSESEIYYEELCESEAGPCGGYHRHEAAAYAEIWNLRDEKGPEEEEEDADPHYGFLGGVLGGDCTNFASAVLHAGGMHFMRSRGRNSTDGRDLEDRQAYKKGTGSWWSYFYNGNNGPFASRLQEATRSWAHAYTLREHLLEYGLARVVEPGEPGLPGDLIFYNLEGTDMSEADHTQIVLRNTNLGLEVVQHSPGYRAYLGAIVNRLDKPGYRLGTDWRYQILRITHTKANILEE